MLFCFIKRNINFSAFAKQLFICNLFAIAVCGNGIFKIVLISALLRSITFFRRGGLSK